MRSIIVQASSECAPEALVERLRGEPGVGLLRSAGVESPLARFSFVVARPFLTLRAFGSRCELRAGGAVRVQFGNPWHVLEGLMARYELLDEIDLPFPLGGCFGHWGYGLKNFVEAKLSRRAVNDLDLPDCQVGFYDSVVVLDHRLHRIWIVSTGLQPDGSRDARTAREACQFWQARLEAAAAEPKETPPQPVRQARGNPVDARPSGNPAPPAPLPIASNLSRSAFLAAVEQAQRYIRAGDIYQVNLSHRLVASCPTGGWAFFLRLTEVSPAPFAAYLDGGDFAIASSSPELFLRLSGRHILTRPIKGTRPRDPDPTRDAQLTYELTTSPKEMSELVMITDLLRNDLGRVCEFGSVHVPELVRLERYAQVQHLVSTVEGRLRADVTHFAALAACFPGGSVTGAPKFRAMEIIDELEPIARGPYTGCIGYLGFNRESQLSIAIRTAVLKDRTAWFHVGAGIVADSVPEAEYDETLAKGRGFLAALENPGAPALAIPDAAAREPSAEAQAVSVREGAGRLPGALQTPFEKA